MVSDATCCAASDSSLIDINFGSGGQEREGNPVDVKENCSCCRKSSETEKITWPAFRRELVVTLQLIFKFLFIAYFLEALISFYVPREWIETILGVNNPFSIVFSTLLGVPLYTTNLTALGLIGGLLKSNMSNGAALAFLISGATTTLPAMSAVYGIVSKKVFTLYLAIIVVGALLSGYLYLLLEFFLF